MCEGNKFKLVFDANLAFCLRPERLAKEIQFVNVFPGGGRDWIKLIPLFVIERQELLRQT